MSSLFRQRSTRVIVSAAIFIALLIAVLFTADRFVGADVVLPGHALLDPEALGNHRGRRTHAPSVTSRHATLDSMLAAASSMYGDRILLGDVTPFDEFASSIAVELLSSEPDEIVLSDLDEPNLLTACVGCLGLSSGRGTSLESTLGLWPRHHIGVVGFASNANGGGASGSSSGTAAGGTVAGLYPTSPPVSHPGNGDGQSSGHSDSSSDHQGPNDQSSGAKESHGHERHDVEHEGVAPRSEVSGPSQTVQTVPEPATGVLVLIGLGGAALVRRRRGRG